MEWKRFSAMRIAYKECGNKKKTEKASKGCEHAFSNRISVAKIQTKMCSFSVLSEVQFDTPM